MIGISACLGGALCRYDGKHQAVPQLIELVRAGQAMMVCPEVLGGLPIPREPAEIVGGDGVDVWAQRAKVVTISGEDVTDRGRCRLCLFSTTRHDCFVRCRMACKTGGSKWKLKRPIA